MAYGLSHELEDEGITVLAVSPGWMRTELVLKEFATDENHWDEKEALKMTETPHYIGKAIVALSNDTNIFEKTGQTLKVGDLAKEYQFRDIDGRYIPSFTI